MPQDGCRLHVCTTGGFIYTEDEVLARLPPHPNPSMCEGYADKTFVLPSNMAPLVSSVLELPPDVDISRVYVGEAFVMGGGPQPFVRAVWFTPSTADRICERPSGSHVQAIADVHEAWQRTCKGQARDAGGGGAVQPAAGVYTELGFGAMPGKGRTSVCSPGGGRSVVPFNRNAASCEAMEPSLSDLMSDVSAVVHDAVSPRVLQTQRPPDSCPGTETDVYQYPRLRPGAPPLHSHQVVLRRPFCMTEDAVESDRLARMAASNLHVDAWDGGGELGTCTVHGCFRRLSDDEIDTTREAHLLLHRGLVVFPRADGGRGVHVRSMVPGWCCALVFRTSACLHGSVVLDETDTTGFALPHLRLHRVVTYPLTRIEVLVSRALRSPAMWEAIHAKSEKSIRQRIDRARLQAESSS